MAKKKTISAAQLRQMDLDALECIIGSPDTAAAVKVQAIQTREKIVEAMGMLDAAALGDRLSEIFSEDD